MKRGGQWRVGAVATVLCMGLAAGASAQYQGWTIPDTAKAEKSTAKSPADAAKKGKSLYASNCAKCHGPEGKGNGPDSDHAADLTDEFRADLNPDGVLVIEIGHERAHFETVFTRTPAVWLPTSAGDDQVLVLTQADLSA